MRVESYPGCCSVKVVVGFNSVTLASAVKELQGIIKRYHTGQVALTAITNISQKDGQRALRKVGFTRTRKKLMKPQVVYANSTYNKIYIWHFELSDENVERAMAVKV